MAKWRYCEHVKYSLIFFGCYLQYFIHSVKRCMAMLHIQNMLFLFSLPKNAVNSTFCPICVTHQAFISPEKGPPPPHHHMRSVSQGGGHSPEKVVWVCWRSRPPFTPLPPFFRTPVAAWFSSLDSHFEQKWNFDSYERNLSKIWRLFSSAA